MKNCLPAKVPASIEAEKKTSCWDRARAAAAVDCMWLSSRMSGGLTEA